jgi:hypothetical protein
MGHRQKCPGCGKKFTVPNVEKNKYGRVKCTCGEPVETWDVFLVDGVVCPSCGNVLRRTPAGKAPAKPVPEPPTDVNPVKVKEEESPDADYADEPADEGEEYEEDEEYVDSQTARKRAEKSRRVKNYVYIAFAGLCLAALVFTAIYVFGRVSKQQGEEKEINTRKDYKYIPPDQDINSPEYKKRKIDPNNPNDRFEEALRLATEAWREERWEDCIKYSKEALAIKPNVREAESLLTTAEVAIDPWKATDKIESIPGFTKPVRALAFSPDGRFLAGAGDDGIIVFWNPDTAKQLFDLQGHTKAVLALAFSPDGKLLASGSADDTISIWDVATQKLINSITQHEDSVNAVVFSPDGKMLASASSDKTVRLWKTDTWEMAFKLEHTDAVQAVVFCRDGTYLASGGLDGKITIWNPSNGENRNSIEIGEKIYSLAFTPEGSGIIAGTFSKPLTIYESATGEVDPKMKEMNGYSGWTPACGFSPDGTVFAAGCGDGLVRIWTNSGAIIRTLDEHKKMAVQALAFRPDGKMLATGGLDKAVILWVPARYKDRK